MLNESGTRLQNIGNWVNKRMFYYACALSSVLMQKHYKGNTTLITDSFGKKLFVDTLDLPYDDVMIELDSLNHYHKGLWAIGKLYAYTLLKTPFIHIDFDFFLANKFSQDFTSSQLVAYMGENSKERQKHYQPYINDHFSKLKLLPAKAEKIIKNRGHHAFNAGIYGGNSIEIFDELWEMSQHIITNNTAEIYKNLDDEYSAAICNIILEQYLFAGLAQEKQLEVNCLEDEKFLIENRHTYRVDTMRAFPQRFVHLVGSAKKSIDSAIYLSEALQTESPYHFDRINSLLSKHLL